MIFPVYHTGIAESNPGFKNRLKGVLHRGTWVCYHVTMDIGKLDAGFAGALVAWYEANARDLPWRRDSEPYRVWLSEIMLQQTRVEAVKPYYARFLAALPDIAALAAADEEQLLKLWEGLGYYSRARNLQKAARVVVEEYGGEFPTSPENIAKLPGIGPYTAGAVASICFGVPVPAVDGNVLRVMARLAAFRGDVEAPAVKRDVARQLAALYPPGKSGAFTQALMELGAVVCVPNGAPQCARCPVAGWCAALAGGCAAELPVKKQKAPRRPEQRTVLVLVHGGRFAIQKRPGRGLLANMWEFPNVAGLLDAEQALATAAVWGLEPEGVLAEGGKKHIFTHIEWDMRFYLLACGRAAGQFCQVTREELAAGYSLPAAFRPPAQVADAMEKAACVR